MCLFLLRGPVQLCLCVRLASGSEYALNAWSAYAHMFSMFASDFAVVVGIVLQQTDVCFSFRLNACFCVRSISKAWCASTDRLSASTGLPWEIYWLVLIIGGAALLMQASLAVAHKSSPMTKYGLTAFGHHRQPEYARDWKLT